MIRLFIVDDHPIVRQGLVAVLEDEADFRIVGTAGSAGHALSVVSECRPDVLLLDLEMPEGNGMEAIPTLLHAVPTLRILVFTAYETEERVRSAVRAGAAGYLLKGVPAAEIADAVRNVHSGGVHFDARIASKTTAQVATPNVSASMLTVSMLTVREAQVLQCVAEGLANKQIAHRLAIAERTVKFHLTSIFQKLEAENRAQAVAVAAQRGLL
jgi:DNA-binding NarL/FixJ family response regulator